MGNKMNDILIAELRKYYEVINERVNIIQRELKDFKFDIDEFEKEIEAKITKRAISTLKAKNFRFNHYENEGDRFSGSLARIDGNGMIEVREFKHKYWNTVNFIRGQPRGMYEILPEGFNDAVKTVVFMLEEIKKYKINFAVKQIANIPITFISNNRIKSDIVEKIKVTVCDVCVKLQSDEYGYDSRKDVYYNDEIFNNVKNLLLKRKDFIIEKIEEIKNKCDKINDFIDNKFDTILVKARLMGVELR